MLMLLRFLEQAAEQTSSPTPAASPEATESAWVQVTGDIAWPLVVLLLALIVVFYRPIRDWLVEQSRKIAKISAFGIDLELTQEGARKVNEATESTFGDLRRHITTEFDRLVRAGKIDEKVEQLIESRVKPVLKLQGLGNLDFRCTVHVADVLYTETLYQLLDYYPSGEGRGRTFSIRFGIVGKTWRLQRDQIEPVISSDPGILIESWGMTVRETSASGRARRSFACVLLKDADQTQVAVIYLDSPTDNAFGASEDRRNALIRSIHQGSQSLGLTRALVDLTSNMQRRGPLISLYRIGTPSRA